VAADVPVTVAAVADALGLPGISLETAGLAADKLAMKTRLAAAGVPVPGYAPVASAAALSALAERAPGPFIVKPVDSRGARGVVRLLPGVEPGWAFAVAAAESPSGRVMVERFIEGPQVSTESVVTGGRTVTVGFSDRNYELLDRFAPYVIENGGELPSRLSPATRAAIEELVARAAAALGVREGTVKGDIVVGPEGPMVIELAARLSGGFFCTHEIPLATGVNLVGAAIRLALGDPVAPADLAPRWSKGVAQRYLFPPPGTVVAVRGVERVAAREGVALVEVRVRPGDRVGPITSHPRRAGVVIAVGDTREEAVRRAVEAAAGIEIVTATVSPVPGATLH
jgi:biotin carboxylase